MPNIWCHRPVLVRNVPPCTRVYMECWRGLNFAVESREVVLLTRLYQHAPNTHHTVPPPDSGAAPSSLKLRTAGLLDRLGVAGLVAAEPAVCGGGDQSIATAQNASSADIKYCTAAMLANISASKEVSAKSKA